MRETSRPAVLSQSGVLLALTGYGLWGLLPLYWRLLQHVDSYEILMHRALSSSVSLGVLLLVLKRGPRLWALVRNGRTVRDLLLGAVVLSANWLLYIWAVTHGHVVDAALGYFINPLLNVALGSLVLKETLTRGEKWALGLALLGVLNLLRDSLPSAWIPLSIAGTFGSYALLRKLRPLPSLEVTFLETSLITPFGLLAFALKFGLPELWNDDAPTQIILGLSGVITVLPLILFTEAAHRLPLTVLGFLQYITPTLQFICGLVVFHETVSHQKLLSFIVIWTALILFSWVQYQRFRDHRRRNPRLREKPVPLPE